MRLLLITAVALALATPAVADAARPGLRLVSSRRIDGRLRELTMRTPALAGPTRLRVLLPRGYRGSRRRYPVLYLLHGAGDGYRSWTEKGDAEQITAGRRVIVVMPDAGTGGWYADWNNDGAGGPPEWETYHVRELIPWIDAHYRTRATRDGRAIAGLSMGGFGAMSYAARHPDEFVAAASFSGAVDIDNALGDVAVPAGVFGVRASNELRWRGHNPTDLAGNLRPLRLTVRTGNGLPGGPYGGGDGIEVAVHIMAETFHRRLTALGIAHVWDDYGPGGHTWPYWQRDLRETLPSFMRAFRHPPAAPRRVTFTAVEPRFDAFGWHVRRARRALAMTTLTRADARGFRLHGRGAATVTTPRRAYAPHRRLTIKVTDARGTHTLHRRADARGRLRMALRLGSTARTARVAVHI